MLSMRAQRRAVSPLIFWEEEYNGPRNPDQEESEIPEAMRTVAGGESLRRDLLRRQGTAQVSTPYIHTSIHSHTPRKFIIN